LQISGTVELAWGFSLSINSAIISKTPQTAYVQNLFLPGAVPHQSVTGSVVYPVPGLDFGCLNAGCSKNDLQKAVAAFNTTYAGTTDAKGNKIAPLVVPSNYQFSDPTFSQDFRLTKVFTFKERYKVSILAEMFNLFNVANLTYPG